MDIRTSQLRDSFQGCSNGFEDDLRWGRASSSDMWGRERGRCSGHTFYFQTRTRTVLPPQLLVKAVSDAQTLVMPEGCAKAVSEGCAKAVSDAQTLDMLEGCAKQLVEPQREQLLGVWPLQPALY